MKKIVLFVLLSPGISSANAQISYGILAGLSHASIRSGTDNVVVEKKFFPSWRAGAAADIPVAGRFHLQPQLLVSTKGSKAELHNRRYKFGIQRVYPDNNDFYETGIVFFLH